MLLAVKERDIRIVWFQLYSRAKRRTGGRQVSICRGFVFIQDRVGHRTRGIESSLLNGIVSKITFNGLTQAL